MPRTVPIGPAGAILDPGNMPLRVMGGGVFELANVTLDKTRRTVSFPAIVNLDQGPMEYFLVTKYGKVHESILRTETIPFHLHVAMLLLDVKSATSKVGATPPQGAPSDPGNQPASKIVAPAKEAISGDPIRVEVQWYLNGVKTTRRAEELILDSQKKSPMENGHWVYNGSQVVGGQFGAQMSGSLVALVTDSDALVNYSGPGHDNDKIWGPNPATLPPKGTPVIVTLYLDAPAEKH